METVDTGNGGVFSFVRRHAGGLVLVLANFTERDQAVPANVLRISGQGYRFTELISGGEYSLDQQHLQLPPYALLWLAPYR